MSPVPRSPSSSLTHPPRLSADPRVATSVCVGQTSRRRTTYGRTVSISVVLTLESSLGGSRCLLGEVLSRDRRGVHCVRFTGTSRTPTFRPSEYIRSSKKRIRRLLRFGRTRYWYYRTHVLCLLPGDLDPQGRTHSLAPSRQEDRRG